MDIVLLTEDNIFDYEGFLTEDVAENIGRTYYRGLVCIDGEEPVSGMVWEYKNVIKEENIESNIIWFTAGSKEASDLMFEEYKSQIKEMNVVKSTFTLPAKTGKTEKQILKEAGFSVALSEGDEITARLSEIIEIDLVKKAPTSDDINPLRFITQRGFNSAIRRLVSSGLYGRCEDLEDLPRAYFENDVSCYSEDDGMINGIFLCHKRPSGKLEISMMASIGKEGVKALPLMIGLAAKSAFENYPPETEIVIDRHNYASLALGEKLFPRGFGIPVYTGSRSEE